MTEYGKLIRDYRDGDLHRLRSSKTIGSVYFQRCFADGEIEIYLKVAILVRLYDVVVVYGN